MEKAQAKTERELGELNVTLTALEKELNELDVQFTAKNDELNQLQTQAALMEKRLGAASKLISGLTGERTRWTEDIDKLQDSRVRLIGDCLLAASFLSYSGAFTHDFRTSMIYKTRVAASVRAEAASAVVRPLDELSTNARSAPEPRRRRDVLPPRGPRRDPEERRER